MTKRPYTDINGDDGNDDDNGALSYDGRYKNLVLGQRLQPTAVSRTGSSVVRWPLQESGVGTKTTANGSITNRKLCRTTVSYTHLTLPTKLSV